MCNSRVDDQLTKYQNYGIEAPEIIKVTKCFLFAKIVTPLDMALNEPEMSIICVDYSRET